MHCVKGKTGRIIALVIGMAGLIVMLAGNIRMNLSYPSPKVSTYKLNEIAKVGNYEIQLTNWQWGDGEMIHEICPGYQLLEIDGEAYPVEKERVGIVEFTITKTKEDDTCLDMTEIAFESGAWGNQFDMELFMNINPQEDTLLLEMEAGETKRILLPMTMLDMQFREHDWEKIDEREFYIVLQYYPQKIQFAL